MNWLCHIDLHETTDTDETEFRQPERRTCTFTDMSRKPMASLRAMLVNESDLRKIADGKLRPPPSGFFNARHKARYRSLVDLARTFSLQLARTSPDGSTLPSQSPFTNEKSHVEQQDGGHIKRVSSVPTNLAGRREARQLLIKLAGHSAAVEAGDSGLRDGLRAAAERSGDGGAEENCFLRVHVPHYVGTMSGASGTPGPPRRP